MERLLRICSLIVSWLKTIFTNNCRLKQNKYSRLWIGLPFHSYVSVCFSVGWVALLLVRPGWRTVRRGPPFWGIFLFWEWRFVKNFRYDSCLLPFLKHVWTEMEFYWEFNWNTLNSSDWFFFLERCTVNLDCGVFQPPCTPPALFSISFDFIFG